MYELFSDNTDWARFSERFFEDFWGDFRYAKKLIESPPRSPIPAKLAMLRCGGRENLLRMSLRRRPNMGASTVSTSAENPARSARPTRFLVTSLSL